MRFLDATEFAESLRLQDNEFVDEICEALYRTDEIMPLYEALAKWIEETAPDKLKTKKQMARSLDERYESIMEWVDERFDELGEIRNKLAENGFDDPNRAVDDLVKECASELTSAHELLRDRGLWTEGDFYDALSTALARVPQFDL